MRRKKFKNRYPQRRKQRKLHVPKRLRFNRNFQTLLRGKEKLITRMQIRRTSFIGLRALTSGYLLNKHYEMLQRFLLPATKHKDPDNVLMNTSIHFFTDHKLSAKPQQSRMGRGKGQPTNLWYAKIYAGQVILEVKGGLLNRMRARRAVLTVMKKLPIRTQLITPFEIHPKTDPTSLYHHIASADSEEEMDESKKPKPYRQKLLPYVR